MKHGKFYGAGYDPLQDEKRLTTQAGRIFKFMRSVEWATLQDIEDATGAPQASASAALRAFRRDDWGGYEIQRERIQEGKGTWKYKLVPKKPKNVDINGQANLF